MCLVGNGDSAVWETAVFWGRSDRSPLALQLLLVVLLFSSNMPALTFTHPTKYGKGSREW